MSHTRAGRPAPNPFRGTFLGGRPVNGRGLALIGGACWVTARSRLPVKWAGGRAFNTEVPQACFGRAERRAGGRWVSAPRGRPRGGTFRGWCGSDLYPAAARPRAGTGPARAGPATWALSARPRPSLRSAEIKPKPGLGCRGSASSRAGPGFVHQTMALGS